MKQSLSVINLIPLCGDRLLVKPRKFLCSLCVYLLFYFCLYCYLFKSFSAIQQDVVLELPLSHVVSQPMGIVP